MNVLCGKKYGGMQMTRKQALSKAISILSEDKKNDEIVLVLQNLLNEYPYSRWRKETVIDSITQYAIEHNNCLPQIHELTKENKLPSKTVIEYLFGYSSINLFYKEYFSEYKIEGYNSPYRQQTIEYFICIFKENYEMMKQNNKGRKFIGARAYDKMRMENTPCSKTIIRNCGLNSYNELLVMCGYIKEYKPIECSVNINYNTEESFDDLLDIINSQQIKGKNINDNF